jgi:hypothetical protein
VSWLVEFQDAYDEWDIGTDVEGDENIRLAALECVLSWKDAGAPDDAEYDDSRESWSFDVPGAPVVIEFVMMRYLDPPVVIVREFRGP